MGLCMKKFLNAAARIALFAICAVVPIRAQQAAVVATNCDEVNTRLDNLYPQLSQIQADIKSTQDEINRLDNPTPTDVRYELGQATLAKERAFRDWHEAAKTPRIDQHVVKKLEEAESAASS
jgi:hypothetical protein